MSGSRGMGDLCARHAAERFYGYGVKNKERLYAML